MVDRYRFTKTTPVKSAERDDADLQLIKKKRLAELIGVRPWTIDNWRKRGLIPAPLVFSDQTVCWRKADIAAWLEAKAREASNG